MKTSKYYRLDEKVGGMRGGKGGKWKAFTRKLGTYASKTANTLSIQTKSRKAKQRAIDAMTKTIAANGTVSDKKTGNLSRRDYDFMTRVLKTPQQPQQPQSSRSRQKESEKLIKVISAMTNSATNKTQLQKNLVGKSRTELITQLRTLKTQKSNAYAKHFEQKTNSNKTNLSSQKQNITTKKTTYNGLIKAKETAKKNLREFKEKGGKKFNPEEYETLSKEVSSARLALKTFKTNGSLKKLKNTQKQFLKKEAAYEKLKKKKGTIDALETRAEQTIPKRIDTQLKKITSSVVAKTLLAPIYYPGKGVYKGLKKTAKAIYSPQKTYRKITGTETSKDFVNKLSENKRNPNKKKEYENKLKEYMEDPEKRAKVEKYSYALNAIDQSQSFKNLIYNKNELIKNWSLINKNLTENNNYKTLSSDEQKIVKNGLRALYMKETYDSMENTLNTKLNKTPPPINRSIKPT